MEPLILVRLSAVSAVRLNAQGERKVFATNVPVDLVTADVATSLTPDGFGTGNPVRLRCGPLDVELGGSTWVERQGLTLSLHPVGDARIEPVEIELVAQTKTHELDALDEVIQDSLGSRALGNFMSAEPLRDDDRSFLRSESPAETWHNVVSAGMATNTTPADCLRDAGDDRIWTAARRLRAASRLTSKALICGGNVLAKGINKTAEAAIKMLPSKNEPVHVSQPIRRGICLCGSGAHMATSTTRALTGVVTQVAGDVGRAAGQIIARHAVQNPRRPRAASPTRRSSDNSPAASPPLSPVGEAPPPLTTTGAAVVLGSAAVQAGADVLEAASSVGGYLLRQGGQSVARVVGHSFGPEVEGAARDGVEVASGVYNTVQNVEMLGIRSLARSAGKTAVTSIEKA